MTKTSLCAGLNMFCPSTIVMAVPEFRNEKELGTSPEYGIFPAGRLKTLRKKKIIKLYL